MPFTQEFDNLRAAAVGLEDAKVVEESAGVELAVDGLDLVLLGAIDGGDGLEDDEASDHLVGLSGALLSAVPGDEDSVAGVPDLVDGEGARGLAGLAGDELVAGGEGRGAEGDGRRAAGVDERDDAVAVVGEVGREHVGREFGGEGAADDVAEVVGDFQRIGR